MSAIPLRRGGVLGAVPDAPSPEPRTPTDAELVAALRRGERWAGAELYARVERVVDRVLCRVLQRRAADHPDLFQETFERLIASLIGGHFRGGCSLSTWAGSIASHVAIDAIRSRTRSKRFTDDAIEERADTRSLTRQLEARSAVTRVQQALVTLDPMSARILILFDLLGHTLGEISELTGLSVSAAQSRLVRGREELRQCLGDQELEEAP